MEIIESYYNQTPNEQNKVLKEALSCSLDSSNDQSQPSTQDQKVISVVDSTILQHVLDLLTTLLKKTDAEKHGEDFVKIVAVFP